MRKKDLIPILLSVFLSVVFVAVAVNAATTISTVINTAGTLNVDGATTLNGNVTLGNATSDTLTLSGATTTLADTTTISSGSMDGTTLRSIYIVPKAAVATAGVNYHKLIEIDGTFGDTTKPSYGLYAGFGRDDATTVNFSGFNTDTGLDIRVTNNPINTAGYKMQGAYIKAKNNGDDDGAPASGLLDTLKGLYVEAQNEEFATVGTLIGVDIGVLADGTETTATGLNFRNLNGAGDAGKNANPFTDIALQYGETIDNKTDGTIAINATTTMPKSLILTKDTFCIEFYATSTDTKVKMMSYASSTMTAANGIGFIVYNYGACN